MGDPFDLAAGWLEEHLLIPVLYQFGLMNWEDVAYSWALVALYGVAQVAVTFAVCLPLAGCPRRWSGCSPGCLGTRCWCSCYTRSYSILPIIGGIGCRIGSAGGGHCTRCTTRSGR